MLSLLWTWFADELNEVAKICTTLSPCCEQLKNMEKYKK